MMSGRYGVDAPGLVRGFLAAGVCFGAAGYALLHWATHAWWALGVVAMLFAVSAYSFCMFGYMLWGSLVTKVKGREAILDLISWTGSEQVLDIGCGRGVLLIGAAHRLTTGHAHGIDLWLQRDQSGNGEEAPLKNAKREGVADRVSVETGDMRELPFPSGSFDVVLSHWVLHNLDRQGDRAQALAEMVRVVRPGGTILLTDIAHRQEYETELSRLCSSHAQAVPPGKYRDVLNALVSFGSFRPVTLIARKA